jgi:hypothetical protein
MVFAELSRILERTAFVGRAEYDEIRNIAEILVRQGARFGNSGMGLHCLQVIFCRKEGREEKIGSIFTEKDRVEIEGFCVDR